MNKKPIELKMVESKISKNAKKIDPEWLKKWKIKIDSEIEAYYGMPETLWKKKSKKKKSPPKKNTKKR